MSSKKTELGKNELPDDPNRDDEMLELVSREIADITGAIPNALQPTLIRRVSDKLFQTIEKAERSAAPTLGNKDIVIDTTVQDDPDNIDSEAICVPAAAVVAVLAGARVADSWKEIPADQRDSFLEKVTNDFIAEVKSKNFDPHRLRESPMWDRALREFVDDIVNSQEEGVQTLINGLPPHVLQSNGYFSVEAPASPDGAQSVAAIVGGTLHRLHRLCGEDRKAIRTEIAGWEQWKNKLIVPSESDIPTLDAIYNDVRIPYEWFADLLSRQSEVRESALDRIRKYGGFLHESSTQDFQEMIRHGVARMTNDGSGYYGVITDHDVVIRHLHEMCGLDPAKQYQTIQDLPSESGMGWPLEWNADPAYALSMFQSPHNVALSVEVAVTRDMPSNPNQQNGRGRRNAGVAAALKDDVYRDPSVDHAWVLTRHFQLVEVGIPEMNRPPEAVSGAVNVGSDVFIRMLGGREIGSAKEKTTIMALDKKKGAHPVELVIRWIFCLAPRKTSLDAIEGRGQRM